MALKCNYYWGTHGCDRERGHDGVHRCGGTDLSIPWDADGDDSPCCEYDEEKKLTRFAYCEEPREWAEWSRAVSEGFYINRE